MTTTMPRLKLHSHRYPALLQHFGETQGALCNAIEQTGQLSDDQQSQIIEIAKEFVQNCFSK